MFESRIYENVKNIVSMPFGGAPTGLSRQVSLNNS